ncbi:MULTISPECIES: ABC transporter permease [Clostridium]|uniref:ABC transporter permease n=1 Tax=Clostridium TaxID=1485 RepID=UPI000825746C|nr:MULTISPECIES: ABC transporter permease [Clostridium]PJI09305.1 ABC transporter permease [Clostridium sp. CT7]
MRLKSLSILLYLKSNFKKCIPQIMVVALGTALMYFMCVLGGGIENQMKNNVLMAYEKLSCVRINSINVNKEKYIDKLRKNKNVEKIIMANMSTVRADMLISNTGSTMLFMSPENTKYVMKKLDFRLTDGKLPQNDNEILLNSNHAKAMNVKVGEKISDTVKEDYGLKSQYKVSGIYIGENIMTFGYIKGVPSELNTNAIVVIPKQGKLNEVNNFIHSFKDSNISITDYKELFDDVGAFFSMFKVFAVLILVILIVVLTFTIGNMNHIHFEDRISEFSILEAVGYRKVSIFYKIFKEMLVIIVSGFILGITCGVLGGNIFNLVYCEPKGVPVGVYNYWYIILSAVIPAVIWIFSGVSSLKSISKMDAVDVLEGKE